MNQKPNNRLKGQTALITGGSSGIGKGVALAMAREGANIIINYNHGAEAAAELDHEIEQMGQRAVTVQADVSREDQVEAMFQQAIAEFGTIDIVVANAGLQQDAAFEDMTLAQWQKVIDVNLTGQFLCMRAAIREFLRRGPRPEISVATGKIICMSSVHEVIPWGGHVNYAASKGGVELLMKSAAQEFGGRKIRINSIAPGAIKTPINRDAWDTPEDQNKLLTLIPYKRIGEPSDIGGVAAWLASDEADYIHGTTLFVDGGMTLYPGFEDNG
jgi:glucose 1-dehydrogenase